MELLTTTFPMSKNIRPFSWDIEVKDVETFIKKEDEYVRLMVQDMRDEGYVPRLDLDPEHTVKYNGKTFDYKLVVYGMFLGKKQAQEIEGVAGTRHWKRIVRNKSGTS